MSEETKKPTEELEPRDVCCNDGQCTCNEEKESEDSCCGGCSCGV